jgi:hypothetical protein
MRKNNWFKKLGWLYLPIYWPGYIITLGFLTFCLHIFIFIDSKSHSVSDTLYGIFPFIIPAFLMYIWVANETSHK